METKNSQTGIYAVSIAILRVLQELFPQLIPNITAGLSLGEYTALTASKRLSFDEGIALVQRRGQYMNDACESTQGTMAVVLGLDGDTVETAVKEVNMPNDLWTANFNCPGQVVLSGTLKGIEVGSAAMKAKGAKRVLPLQVHGAFHSGLMKSAERNLTPYIEQVSFKDSTCRLVMNVPGAIVENPEEICQQLIRQVTHSVRWEQGVRCMSNEGVDAFIEIGCRKTLAGFNKHIGVAAPTMSIDKVSDIPELELFLTRSN
jgi:[acyl-carrier-protein] S-malonyltransferase